MKEIPIDRQAMATGHLAGVKACLATWRLTGERRVLQLAGTCHDSDRE